MFTSIILAIPLLAQNSGEPESGFILLAPLTDTNTYLLDNQAEVIHTWPGSVTPGNAAYLLPNGNLLRTLHLSGTVGGSGGGLQEIDLNGNVIFDFTYDNADHLSHHDVEVLPNGNVLIIAWEYMTRAEAIAEGRNPAYLQGPLFAPDHLIEVVRSGPSAGQIVWEWHVIDHVVQDFDATKANYGIVADHPELIDLNYPPRRANQGDWNHVNTVDYHPEFDQIVISSHALNEFWVIDHSTTTAEAASHSGGRSGMGGDILYRWGNPEAYDRGTQADRKLWGQHDVQWIEEGKPGEGNFLLFNNGNGRPAGPWSSIDELTPPVDTAGNYSLQPGAA
ncbi:MAG TPA: arylsulfotransferase (ASST), partial [Planctomycetes bacterium]|nr:arylsulfotransferase (ASST) [Planctomycetota bacterium]